MFIRCRRICASRERCKKHPPRYSKHRPRYSKHRPKYSDNGRDRPLLGTPSSGGRFRLNIEQRTVASNRSGWSNNFRERIRRTPRKNSIQNFQKPSKIACSAIQAQFQSRCTSRRTLMEVGDQTRVSRVFRTHRSTRTGRRGVDVFCTRQLVRLLARQDIDESNWQGKILTSLIGKARY